MKNYTIYKTLIKTFSNNNNTSDFNYWTLGFIFSTDPLILPFTVITFFRPVLFNTTYYPLLYVRLVINERSALYDLSVSDCKYIHVNNICIVYTRSPLNLNILITKITILY